MFGHFHFKKSNKAKTTDTKFTVATVRDALGEAKRACQYLNETDLYTSTLDSDVRKLMAALSECRTDNLEELNNFKKDVVDFSETAIEAMKSRVYLAQLSYSGFKTNYGSMVNEIEMERHNPNHPLAKILKKNPDLARLADEVILDLNLIKNGEHAHTQDHEVKMGEIIPPNISEMHQQAADILARHPLQIEMRNNSTPSMRK